MAMQLLRFLKKLTPVRTFEELDIPLTTVSTDIVNNVKIEYKK